MGRVNSQRQKNRPFKAKSKAATAQNKTKTLGKKKPIEKQKARIRNTKVRLIQQKKIKKTAQADRINAKNQYLDKDSKSAIIEQIKNEPHTKIVVLLPGNSQANTNTLIQQMFAACQQLPGISLKTDFKYIPYPTLQITPTGKAFIKNKLLIISGERIGKQGQSTSRDIQSLLDLIKCSDIICPVLSCKNTDVKNMALDPLQKGGAFDELGYTMINLIRSFGTPTTIGIVQDLIVHQPRHHDKIQRLFRRFISSQLNENDRINSLKGPQDINKLIRQFDSTTPQQHPWRVNRGYMLIQDITTDEGSGNLTFHGVVKGNSVHANQLVHVVGFEDYQIEKIQIKQRNNSHHHNSSMSQQTAAQLIQYSSKPQTLFPFSKAEQISEDILSGFNKLQIDEELKQNKSQMGQSEDDIKDDSQADMDEDENDYSFQNNKEEEKQKRIQMQMRKQDELQFDDEVEYAAQQILREKFKEYQGLKNLKTSDWNHLENLPDEYDRIYTFKHYQRTYHTVLAENQAKSFAYPNFNVAVTIKGLPKDLLLKAFQFYPTILVFLLKHERKMTQVHLKVKRNPFYHKNETVVESNQLYSISMGFRRQIVRPIFSRVISGTQKTKFIKKIEEDYENYFYCTFYSYNCFPPSPVQIYQVNQLNTNDREASPVMYGTLAKCDPLQIILQRIILTGYPYKINKRRSTIRFMFFNPKDVKYFKPVEVRTKMGLKGRIEESLGTHGLMKVLFNDKIKHNDTVCMNLYRRVYPMSNF